MKIIDLVEMAWFDFTADYCDKLMKKQPDRFIRAELPEFWRVEGYEKSWEWLFDKPWQPRDTNWEWVSNLIVCSQKKGYDGFNSSHKQGMQLPQISRAEFEYHIYNPWKRGIEVMKAVEEDIKKSRLNEQSEQDLQMLSEAKQEFQQVEQSAFKPSELYSYMAENHNVTLLGSEEAEINEIVFKNIDTIKQQAERMGYELVRKVIKWESTHHKFKMETDWVNITDKEDDKTVCLNPTEIETLIKKYNEFKSIP